MVNEMFHVPEPNQPEGNKQDKPTPEQQELIDKFAHWVVKKGLTVPAIIAIETGKPLNWITSQAMLIGEPAVWALDPMLKAAFKFSHKDYLVMQKLLENRWANEVILQTLEKLDVIAKDKEYEIKKEQKAKRKELKAQRKTKRAKFFRKIFGSQKPEDLK